MCLGAMSPNRKSAMLYFLRWAFLTFWILALLFFPICLGSGLEQITPVPPAAYRKFSVVGPSSYVKVAIHHGTDTGGDAWFLSEPRLYEMLGSTFRVWLDSNKVEWKWKALKDLLEGCTIINNHSTPTNVRSVLEFLKCQNCFHSCKEYLSFREISIFLNEGTWNMWRVDSAWRPPGFISTSLVSLSDTRETWPPETGNVPSE